MGLMQTVSGAAMAVQMFFASLLAPLTGPMVCRVENATHINVVVRSDDIDYDYSKGAAELKALENRQATFPAAPGPDRATGGLREDHPTVATIVNLDILSNEWRKQGCVRYKSVEIDLHLRPRIYVAKEYDSGTCRQAVLAHELKHVGVDRAVMNKYGAMMAPAVQDVINRTGALGPFDVKDMTAVKGQAAGYITAVTDRLEKTMERELDERQRAVDTPEEYAYVGGFCHEGGVRR